VMPRARRLIAAQAGALADAIGPAPGRPGRTRADSLSAEILPLADACRFLQRAAPALLRPRRLGARGRPLWLTGVDAELRREPFGLVLVIAPGNYPLMLAGVQTVQALAAGNAVAWKPPSCSRDCCATPACRPTC
jgi:acyl-CoA reductase-like NAD-dependent aldehyde dehydrogenase